MGDRALVVFTDTKRKRFSPVVYLHQDGYRVGTFLRELADLMQTRNDDVHYAAARFVGICHSHIEGNMSLGMWNLDSPNPEATLREPDFSHGDAGVFLVEVGRWQAMCFDGYGFDYEAETREMHADLREPAYATDA